MKDTHGWIVWVFLALVASNAALLLLADPEGEPLRMAGFLLPVLFGGFAVAGLLVAVRGFAALDVAKRSWSLVGIGIGLWLLGETSYALLDLVGIVDVDAAETTVADIFWCAGYLPLLAGLWLLLAGYRRSRLPLGHRSVYLLLCLATVAVALFLTVTLFLPILGDAETSLAGKIVYLFYPLFDLPLMLLALVLAYVTSVLRGGKISRPWRWMAFGFLLMTISDVSYSYLSWTEAYNAGNIIDLGWNAGYLALGVAGFSQRWLIDSFGKQA